MAKFLYFHNELFATFAPNIADRVNFARLTLIQKSINLISIGQYVSNDTVERLTILILHIFFICDENIIGIMECHWLKCADVLHGLSLILLYKLIIIFKFKKLVLLSEKIKTYTASKIYKIEKGDKV